MITALALTLLLQQTSDGSPPKATREAADRVICRNEPQPATRITVPVCMSRLAWQSRREAMEHNRVRNRPVIDNRRMGRGIGRW